MLTILGLQADDLHFLVSLRMVNLQRVIVDRHKDMTGNTVSQHEEMLALDRSRRRFDQYHTSLKINTKTSTP